MNEEARHLLEQNVAAHGIAATARRLASAMLYSKALQNIPLVGVAGGTGDLLCLRRVRRYAAIKYQKRFLTARRLGRM